MKELGKLQLERITTQMDAAKMRSLAYVRYLYTLGVEQSKLPEPLNMTALLLFHDAIDLFLGLGSEHLNAGKNGQSLMAVWEPINAKLPAGTGLAQKDSTQRLTTARNGIKHSGVIIAKSEMDAFRLSVADFFEENTPRVFGIGLAEVSMASLVRYDNVRASLGEAEASSGKGDIEEAAKKLALAFHQLLQTVSWASFETNHQLPMEHTTRLSPASIRSITPELKPFANEVQNAIEVLTLHVRILSLGIDYQHYTRFQMLAPIVHQMMSGAYDIQSRKMLTSDEYTFCYNFVLESILRLQQSTS